MADTASLILATLRHFVAERCPPSPGFALRVFEFHDLHSLNRLFTHAKPRATWVINDRRKAQLVRISPSPVQQKSPAPLPL